MTDGTCQNCEEFTIPDYTFRECEEATCDSRNIVKSDGTCEICPDHFELVPGDDRNC